MNNEIVITAIGFNAPYGVGKEVFWDKLGRPSIEHTSQEMIVEQHDPQQYLNPKGQKFLNKATLLYCNVAFQTIEERNLRAIIEARPERVGLYDGSELSNLEDCFVFDLTAKNAGPDKVSPMKAPNTIANAAASQMAIQAGIKGPNFSVCNGKAGSLLALDVAYMHLKQRLIDFGIVASTEIANGYQASLRRGLKSAGSFYAPELGVSLMVERKDSSSTDNSKAYATILDTASGTPMQDEGLEQLSLRLVKRLAVNHRIDLIVVSGGAFAINAVDFRQLSKEWQGEVPVIFPETIFGANDNAGGLLGVIYTIGLLEGRVKPHEERVTALTMKDEINSIVLSVDEAGTGIAVLISGRTKKN